jgi:hypothetical protein
VSAVLATVRAVRLRFAVLHRASLTFGAVM